MRNRLDSPAIGRTDMAALAAPPAAARAALVVGGIEASPEFEKDGELHVYGPEGSDHPIRDEARRIAAALRATVSWVEDL
jgi:hypothetical protein